MQVLPQIVSSAIPVAADSGTPRNNCLPAVRVSFKDALAASSTVTEQSARRTVAAQPEEKKKKDLASTPQDGVLSAPLVLTAQPQAIPYAHGDVRGVEEKSDSNSSETTRDTKASAADWVAHVSNSTASAADGSNTVPQASVVLAAGSGLNSQDAIAASVLGVGTSAIPQASPAVAEPSPESSVASIAAPVHAFAKNSVGMSEASSVTGTTPRGSAGSISTDNLQPPPISVIPTSQLAPEVSVAGKRADSPASDVPSSISALNVKNQDRVSSIPAEAGNADVSGLHASSQSFSAQAEAADGPEVTRHESGEARSLDTLANAPAAANNATSSAMPDPATGKIALVAAPLEAVAKADVKASPVVAKVSSANDDFTALSAKPVADAVPQSSPVVSTGAAQSRASVTPAGLSVSNDNLTSNGIPASVPSIGEVDGAVSAAPNMSLATSNLQSGIGTAPSPSPALMQTVVNGVSLSQAPVATGGAFHSETTGNISSPSKETHGAVAIRDRRKQDNDPAAATDEKASIPAPVRSSVAPIQHGSSDTQTHTGAGGNNIVPTVPSPSSANDVKDTVASGDGKAAAGSSQADAGSLSAGIPAQIHATPAISSAQLIQTMHQSEMRVGMHSTEFGQISINTSVGHQSIAAQISLDHAELGRALAVHLPSIEEKLGAAYGLQARVEVRDGSGASSGDTAQNPRENRQGQGSASPGSAMSYGQSAGSIAQASASSAVSSGRLDIRI